MKIIKAIAMHDTDEEIIKMCRREMQKELTAGNLKHYRYRPHWKPMLEKFREEFEAHMTEEDLASKRRRVQELSKAYRRLVVEDETLVDAVNVLGKIREEVEGKTSGALSINQYNQFNSLSDEDLRRVIDENTKFLSVIENRKKEIPTEATDA